MGEKVRSKTGLCALPIRFGKEDQNQNSGTPRRTAGVESQSQTDTQKQDRGHPGWLR